MKTKRWSDSDDEDNLLHPAPKRPKVPALARVIVEALQMDNLQRICSSFEPIIRRVVSEEVERALIKQHPGRLGGRCSPKRIEGSDGRNLQLHLRARLSLPIFTGAEIEGEEGAPIHIVLVDANTGCPVTSGPEASAKLDVLVLNGDFNNEENDSWTEDEFERHVVKEREGKRPLLTGELQVSLKEGVGTLGKLNFTDNSSWIPCRKFRLGLKVTSTCCKGTRIREVRTEAFIVKERRGQLYLKHHPPALEDELWRLETIAKDGQFHSKLNKIGIQTVGDFIKSVARDTQGLRTILGSAMSDKMWKKLVEHANTAVLVGKHYIYYLDLSRNTGAIFNSKSEFCGLIDGDQFMSAECLNDGRQKNLADILVNKAYDNWTDVIMYDGKDLLNFAKSERAAASQKEILLAPAECSSSYDLQVPQKHSQTSVPNSEQCAVTMDAAGEVVVSVGYDDNQPTICTNHPQNADSNTQMLNESTSYASQNLIAGSIDETQATRKDRTDLEVAKSDAGFHQFSQIEGLSTYHDFSEEIRSMSHAFLQGEGMQNALHGYCTDETASLSFFDGGFDISASPPWQNYFNFDHEQNHTSGRASVGWLKITKITAALRWAFFIRKKAADRRRKAKLIELED